MYSSTPSPNPETLTSRGPSPGSAPAGLPSTCRSRISPAVCRALTPFGKTSMSGRIILEVATSKLTIRGHHAVPVNKHGAYGGQSEDERQDVRAGCSSTITVPATSRRGVSRHLRQSRGSTIEMAARPDRQCSGIVERHLAVVRRRHATEHCGHVAVRLRVLPTGRERLRPCEAVPGDRAGPSA